MFYFDILTLVYKLIYIYIYANKGDHLNLKNIFSCNIYISAEIIFNIKDFIFIAYLIRKITMKQSIKMYCDSFKKIFLKLYFLHHIKADS